MSTKSFDFIVIGSGVIGLQTALELRKKYPTESIVILEKETTPSYHASGRNSGVLHAGFYYTADSLKAKFTAEGNKYLHDYCEENKIPINKCGKLVVTRNEIELKQLDVLKTRAKANNVHLEEISLKECKSIEPRAKTYEKALWSPLTSSVDPKQVLASFTQDAKNQKIEILYNCTYLGKDTKNLNLIYTSLGPFQFGYLVNCAGLYADKVAQDFGFSKKYRILPFKGLYLYQSSEHFKPLNCHIYPVPNLKNPFLGVHFTQTVDGITKIGPTAIPAFWREQYSGFSRFKWNEFTQIAFDELMLFFKAGFDFRSLAFEEIKKYLRPILIKEASTLVEGIKLSDFRKWGKPGIRAQLMNIETKTLVMDFCYEGDQNSMHVLNAVSPAFTCSQPFSRFIVDRIEQIKAKKEISQSLQL